MIIKVKNCNECPVARSMVVSGSAVVVCGLIHKDRDSFERSLVPFEDAIRGLPQKCPLRSGEASLVPMRPVEEIDELLVNYPVLKDGA